MIVVSLGPSGKRRLGMAWPVSAFGTSGLNFLNLQAQVDGQLCKVWYDVHVPRV